MNKLFLAASGAVGLLASSVLGQTINVGNHVLLPNRTGQSFTLPVTGGTAVQGLNFNAQIAGGGTANGGSAGPVMSNVDLITGTIFGPNNTGQQNITSLDTQVYSGSVITNSGTVPASGTLATMIIDTTGFNGGGIYPLKLAGFSNNGVSGNTDFAIDSNGNTIPANVTNGNLIVIYPGDADENGAVALADYNTVVRNFGTGTTWALGHFDTSTSATGLSDYNSIVRNFGLSVNINPLPPSISSAAVETPEPGTPALMGIAASLLLRRRR